jgi:importin-5
VGTHLSHSRNSIHAIPTKRHASIARISSSQTRFYAHRRYSPFEGNTLTSDEIEKEQYPSEDGWDFIPVHGQQVGIKTSVLEEKCTAYEMLVCYAQELKGDFFPYVPSVLETLVIPGLKFYFHDGVRAASAKCLPALVESAKLANPHDLSIPNKIFRTVIDTLLARIEEEGSPDICSDFFEAFYETVDVAGDNCLSAQDMNSFIDITASQLRDYGTRKTARDEQVASGDRDIEEDEDLQEAIDADEVLLSAISKSIHNIFKRHKLSFLPIWAKMTPFVEAGLASSESNTRSWSFCIIDDVIEYCGGDALPYIGNYLPAVVNSVTDECTSFLLKLTKF